MRWEADVKIAGPVGSMGQRVLQPIVNQQVSQVLNALDRQVQTAQSSAAEGLRPARRDERHRRCAAAVDRTRRPTRSPSSTRADRRRGAGAAAGERSTGRAAPTRA